MCFLNRILLNVFLNQKIVCFKNLLHCVNKIYKNMKQNLKLLTIAGLSAILMSSCVIQTNMITDNPIGTKVGVAKLRIFAKDKDITLEKAAQNGGIKKIGLVEVRTTYFIIPFVKTTVYGE